MDNKSEVLPHSSSALRAMRNRVQREMLFSSMNPMTPEDHLKRLAFRQPLQSRETTVIEQVTAGEIDAAAQRIRDAVLRKGTKPNLDEHEESMPQHTTTWEGREELMDVDMIADPLTDSQQSDDRFLDLAVNGMDGANLVWTLGKNKAFILEVYFHDKTRTEYISGEFPLEQMTKEEASIVREMLAVAGKAIGTTPVH